MATADEYAAWIVKNKDRKGTPEFDVVAKAYQEAKSAQGKYRQSEPEGMPGARQEPSFARQTGQFLGNLAAGAVRGAGSIGATLIRPFETAAENEARRRAMDEVFAEFGAEPSSMTYGAGKLAAEIAGTAGVGGLIAAPVKLAARAAPALAPAAAAIESAGVGAPTVLGKVGGGAVTGAASSGLVDPGATGTGAVLGAAFPFAAPVLNKLGQLAAQGAGTLMDIRQLPNQLAAQIARKSFNTPEQVAAARAALQAPEAAGLTAQQALARGNIIAPGAQATIEKAVKKTGAVDTRAAIEASQETARESTIKNVTPDLQAAIDARRAASKPLYEAADQAVVPIDSALTDVISRMPEGTLAAAANIAKMEGRPFIMGKTTPAKMVETGVLDAAGKPVMKEVPGQTAEITGESMHYIKRALSDIAYGPTATTGAGRDTQLAARKLLEDYVKVFEAKVPQYGQARQTFSDLSAPVNQAQVLKEMLSVLEKPGGGERIGPFLNVLGRGEEAMLKRAGGRGGARFESLSEVLTPEQISAVRDVARQLESQTVVKTQVSVGQQRATELIKDELPNYRLPNIFNVFATTANKVLDVLGQKVSEKTIRRLADASLSAKSFDEMLATLPGEERSKVLRAISDPSTWANITTKLAKTSTAAVGGAETPAPVNNLAPAAAPANALAR